VCPGCFYQYSGAGFYQYSGAGFYQYSGAGPSPGLAGRRRDRHRRVGTGTLSPVSQPGLDGF